MNNIIKTDFETIKDERGEIKKIAQNVDVLTITSVKGSIRALHSHNFSSHLCLLKTGAITYYEREVNSAHIKPTKVEIKPGDYFYTGPGIDHQMSFTENSIFDCFSFGSREKNNYENDLIRISYKLSDIYNNWKD